MGVCLVPCLTPNKPDRQKGQNKSEMHRISQTGQNCSCLSYSAPLSQAGISQTGTFWGVWLIPWSMGVWLIPCPVAEKGVWLIPWSEFWLIPWSCLTYYCHPIWAVAARYIWAVAARYILTLARNPRFDTVTRRHWHSVATERILASAKKWCHFS